jgi:hypothetical protein
MDVRLLELNLQDIPILQTAFILDSVGFNFRYIYFLNKLIRYTVFYRSKKHALSICLNDSTVVTKRVTVTELRTRTLSLVLTFLEEEEGVLEILNRL